MCDEKNISDTNTEVIIKKDVDGTEICLPAFCEEKERRRFALLGCGLSLYAAISTLAFFIINAVVISVAPDIADSNLFLNIAGNISYYLCALPVLLLFVGRIDAGKLERKKVSPSALLICFVVGFGLMGIGGYIGDFVSGLFGPSYVNHTAFLADSGELWQTALFFVVVAPLGEEFIFRKLVIDRLQRYGGRLAIIMSSVIFALAHGNMYQIFYSFLVGLVLGYLYQSSGKLHLTVLLHAILNFFGSVLPLMLQNAMNYINAEILLFESLGQLPGAHFELRRGLVEISVITFMILRIACMICSVLLPVILYKRIVICKGEVEIPRGRVFAVSVINVGMIALFLIYLSNIFVGIVFA